MRPEIRALTAYHVAPADGHDQARRDGEPVSRCRRRCAAELGRRARRGRRSTAIPTRAAPRSRRRCARARRSPTRSALMLGNGSDELIQIDHRGARASGRGDARARAVVRHVPAERDASRGMRYVGVPLRRGFRARRATRCWPAIERERPALIFLAYPNNPTGNLFAAGDVERDHPRARRDSSSSTRRTTRSPSELPAAHRRIPESAGAAHGVQDRHGRHASGLCDRRARVDRASSTRCARRIMSTR